MNWMVQAASEAVKEIFTRVGSSLWTVLGAVVILFVGWMIAGWLQRLVVQFLRAVRLDDLADTLRINEALQKGEIRNSLSELLGIFLYWLIILATLLAAFNVLGLTLAAELLEKVLAYVPNVVAGVIVLILGLFFATLMGGIVQTAAANAGVGQAKALGQIARVVVVIFSVAVALEKFFSSVIVQTTFSIVVAAVAFGLALAFGLGCKDIAGKYVGDFLDKLRRR
ncbi:MAG: hypothetical protein HY211_04780 [Candidatus Omnitrophica bacterium]|nr:hypothetical protein [Candidatus Omnitrophota bacterium]